MSQAGEALVAGVGAALEPLPKAARVIVALSGGPDSTGLLELTCRARPDLGVVVVHVRHGLRDDAADAAIAWDHAQRLGLEFLLRCVAVDPADRTGVEAAARLARYAALANCAHAIAVDTVLVGHTADDQAETVLLRLARGAGLRGLAGMAAWTARAVQSADGPAVPLRIGRPLLGLRRGDVHAFVAEHGLTVAVDPMNADPRRRRARVRNSALPAFAALSGGPSDGVAVLVRTARLARDDAEALDALASREAAAHVRAWGAARMVRTSVLEALPTALASRVVRTLLSEVRAGLEGLGADAVTAALTLRPGQSLSVSRGALVTAGGGWLAAVPAGHGPLLPRTLSAQEATLLQELGVQLEFMTPPVAPPATPPVTPVTPPWDGVPARALVPACVGTPVGVRSRHPGDRLQSPSGPRKLADLFISAGVPRALRDLVPVVVDGHDQPLWVPGVGVADPGGADLRDRVELRLVPAVGASASPCAEPGL